MKKVYIPTEEELYSLQNMGVNVYSYLLTKTIESIIMADVIYEEEDMFDVAYDEFGEYPQIAYSIARMYPEKISESERASSDINLCKKIIPTFTTNNMPIHGLEYLKQFKPKVLNNKEVLKEIIVALERVLQTNPRYRFEYSGPNATLDDIFACEVPIDIIPTFNEIVSIDPIYAIKTPKKSHQFEPKEVVTANNRYSSRYGINTLAWPSKIDVLTKPNEKVKKLIRHLENHKNNYQE